MKKTVLIFILTVCLIGSNFNKLRALSHENSTVSPRYVSTCNGGGKHKMVPQGVANFYSGNSLQNLGEFMFKGTASKCTKCEIMVFSEIYPTALINRLGRYVINTHTYQNGSAYIVYGPYQVCNNIYENAVLQGFEWW